MKEKLACEEVIGKGRRPAVADSWCRYHCMVHVFLHGFVFRFAVYNLGSFGHAGLESSGGWVVAWFDVFLHGLR